MVAEPIDSPAEEEAGTGKKPVLEDAGGAEGALLVSGDKPLTLNATPVKVKSTGVDSSSLRCSLKALIHLR